MSRLAVSIVLGSLLTTVACKSAEDKSANTKSAGTQAAPAAAPATVPADMKIIESTLALLADATIKSAKSEDKPGLPEFSGEMGIACGSDAILGAVLARIGVEAKSLQTNKGFRFEDLCVGWRPYIRPATEMYWMISAGTPAEGESALPIRRCQRVLAGASGYSKDPPMDGPCLSIHRL